MVIKIFECYWYIHRDKTLISLLEIKSKIYTCFQSHQEEIKEFFKYKEQQYKDRKDKLFRMCGIHAKLGLHASHTSMDTNHGQYVVDPEDGLDMCRIAKATP